MTAAYPLEVAVTTQPAASLVVNTNPNREPVLSLRSGFQALASLDKAIAQQRGCTPAIPRRKGPMALNLLKRQHDILCSDYTFDDLIEYITIAGAVKTDLYMP
ncbi:hypothetical protein QBC46DRAFT_348891 [Diplogelasinospora grovesii]|uniref:Uncharacterized protein n=1 Tax=Diplogelasinospora grovesii TaxID=303347 RepID=A0AAN6NK39_9PEZI|nr:hypothetical protein QBC46DRAFT_348891 [Diplogelasinospora grovesii]